MAWWKWALVPVGIFGALIAIGVVFGEDDATTTTSTESPTTTRQVVPDPGPTEPVECPAGEVTTTLTEAVVTGGGEPTYDMRIAVEIANGTTAPIRVHWVELELRVAGRRIDDAMLISSQSIEPGETASIEEVEYVRSLSGPPDETVVADTLYAWDNGISTTDCPIA